MKPSELVQDRNGNALLLKAYKNHIYHKINAYSHTALRLHSNCLNGTDTLEVHNVQCLQRKLLVTERVNKFSPLYLVSLI